MIYIHFGPGHFIPGLLFIFLLLFLFGPLRYKFILHIDPQVTLSLIFFSRFNLLLHIFSIHTSDGSLYLEFIPISWVLWRYRYRLYRTHQHRTGTDNYRYSNRQGFRVYWLYWGDKWIYIHDRWIVSAGRFDRPRGRNAGWPTRDPCVGGGEVRCRLWA